jgi:hypothetical protein
MEMLSLLVMTLNEFGRRKFERSKSPLALLPRRLLELGPISRSISQPSLLNKQRGRP